MIPDARISDLRRNAIDASIFIEIRAYKYIAAMKFFRKVIGLYVY